MFLLNSLADVFVNTFNLRFDFCTLRVKLNVASEHVFFITQNPDMQIFNFLNAFILENDFLHFIEVHVFWRTSHEYSVTVFCNWDCGCKNQNGKDIRANGIKNNHVFIRHDNDC